MLMRSSEFDAVAVPAVTPGFVELTWGPLRERLRRGEGALLAVNAAWLAFAWPGAVAASGLMALSALVLMAAYAFNDWHDARDDLHDPKKNPALVAGLIERRTPFGVWLGALHVALVVAAGVGAGAVAALAVAGMLAINTLYSLRLKRVPLADLVVVGLWGAAFTAIVAAPVWLCATVGLMTSIMHLFQIQQDRGVDARNRIDTTVVRWPGSAVALLTLICVGLGLLLLPVLGPWGAGSAAIPCVLRLTLRDTLHAWMACRAYCGLVLIAALLVSQGLG